MAADVALRPPWCPPPTPPHAKISQHTMRQVYVAKTTEYNCFYNIYKLFNSLSAKSVLAGEKLVAMYSISM
jgi:hypothetical protein